jgi:hypothetical protein
MKLSSPKLRASAATTVAIDGWTNVQHDKVINVLPVTNGVAYYWQNGFQSWMSAF